MDWFYEIGEFEDRVIVGSNHLYSKDEFENIIKNLLEEYDKIFDDFDKIEDELWGNDIHCSNDYLVFNLKKYGVYKINTINGQN